jgi:hypothetical protein
VSAIGDREGRPDQGAAGPPGKVRIWIGLAVLVLLAAHVGLAERSLSQENPTVDEVAHMPAGVTYWQTGTFKLYPHNPPLVKLVAALPVVWASPNTALLYQQPSWTEASPSHPTFSQTFSLLNRDRYFELFQLARMVMPLFSVLGGLVVFVWSARLYGPIGGLLSLALWVFCPNILAHGRLVTTDLGSTAVGAGATYLFWRYLHQPSWKRALAAGVALGLAELTKFSMLILLPVWPSLWLLRTLLVSPAREWARCAARAIPHALIVLAACVLVIDVGYGFEGVGTPLEQFEFASGSLTRPVPPGMGRPRSRNLLLDVAWRFRVNRFRGSLLGKLPAPLPRYYLLGFDEQKLEAEGIPRRFFLKAQGIPDSVIAQNADDDKVAGYHVYLNGEMRDSGWWSYYLLTLVYKVPEGTWGLVLLSLVVLIRQTRSSAAWADELTLATIPAIVLFAMSVLTDINLGLRYVLPIAPYAFIATGKVVPWAAELRGGRRFVATGSLAALLGLTVAACLTIHPHYLAYFNWSSGGPDRIPARLIDSNLDWGQDLVGLQRWASQNIPGKPIGLAYFGQINPTIFATRGEPFDWFLPPVQNGPLEPMNDPPSPNLVGSARRLRPGYYAISATLLYGLPWRLYDPAPPIIAMQEAWAPAWNARKPDAFGYFRRFAPITRIGHSIYVYYLTQEDVDRVSNLFSGPVPAGSPATVLETPPSR